eukprot:COSAG05_NODE_47_length_24712_cov_26.673844_11_plen_839_part_00
MDPSGPDTNPIDSAKAAGWQDATAFLAAVSEKLAVGQMVQAPQFDLLSAMSALEIMDPKMDAGMVRESTTINGALGTDLMPFELTAGQIVHLVDLTLVGEMRWVSGHSLAQTVFTCMYLHDNASHVNDCCYRAMCRGTLKCCAIIRSFVVRADFYEEEDFVPQTFGFDMCELSSAPDILQELLLVEQRLATRVKFLKQEAIDADKSEAHARIGERLERLERQDGTGNGMRDDGSVAVTTCCAGENEIEMCEAIRARLAFRRGYLNALHQLQHKGVRSAESARRAIKFALAQLVTIQESVSLGTTAQQSAANSSFGFHADINRRLLGPSPPRAIDPMDVGQAVSAARSLLESISALLEVAKQTSMSNLVGFFCRFSDDVDPNVVSSSLLMELFFSSDEKLVLGRTKIEDLVVCDAGFYGISRDLHTSVDDAQPFWEFFSRTMLYAFRVLCKNRSRQHRKLARILQSFAHLQEEAAYLDQKANELASHNTGSDKHESQERSETSGNASQSVVLGVYAAYTIQWTTYFMIRHLVCGFKLGLYPMSEWRLIYWYMDNLLTHRLHALLMLGRSKVGADVRAAKTNMASTAQHQRPDTAKKKGKRGRKARPQSAPATGTVTSVETGGHPQSSMLRVEQLLLSAQRALCAASFRFLSGLIHTGQLNMPKHNLLAKLMPSMDTVRQQRLQFSHRFEPFRQLLQPTPLQWDQYVHDCAIPSNVSAAGIFKQASDYYKSCAQNLDKMLALGRPNSSGHENKYVEEQTIAMVKGHGEMIEQWKEVCTQNLAVLSQLARQSDTLLQITIKLPVESQNKSPQHCFPVANLPVSKSSGGGGSRAISRPALAQ